MKPKKKVQLQASSPPCFCPIVLLCPTCLLVSNSQSAWWAAVLSCLDAFQCLSLFELGVSPHGYISAVEAFVTRLLCFCSSRKRFVCAKLRMRKGQGLTWQPWKLKQRLLANLSWDLEKTLLAGQPRLKKLRLQMRPKGSPSKSCLQPVCLCNLVCLSLACVTCWSVGSTGSIAKHVLVTYVL